MSASAVPVVMYHGVAPDLPDWPWNDLITPVDVFEKQMYALKRNGWNTVTLAALYDHMADGTVLPEKPVVLTFDDGYLNNWVFAYPILRKYGLHAVVWMSTDFIDYSEETRPNLEDVWKGRSTFGDLPVRGFLSVEEMREMISSDVIEIQSHGRTHTWHFTGPHIVDFHRPSGIDGYVTPPWLSWNMRPGGKSGYMSRDPGKDIPWGTPVYEHERALVARRYFPDPRTAEALRAHVDSSGGGRFFDRAGWRDELNGLVEKRGPEDGRYESREEYEARVRDELAGSKEVLSRILSRDVDFLCWPGGGYNDAAERIALETGYLATTTHFLDSKMKNVHGEDARRINRIGCGSWDWRGRMIRRTDPGFFIAMLEAFAGSRFSLWKMRLYKIKYLFRYFIAGNR